jgi:hypothetical protein
MRPFSARIGEERSLDLKAAIAVAKQHIGEVFAADAPHNIRLEQFLWDDHLGVWTLTMGFASGNESAVASDARTYKVLRVSEGGKSVLSIKDA